MIEPAEQIFTITLTRGLNGPLEARTVTQAEMWEILSTHTLEPSKSNARAFIPAELTPCPTPCRNTGRGSRKNCGGGQLHRLSENVRSISFFVVDVDKQPQADVETLLAHLDTTGLAYVYATTWSHRPPVECSARIIIPLTRPYAIGDARHWSAVVWPLLMQRVGLSPEAAIAADPQCKDASRLYFLPSVSSDSAPREVRVREGAAIDVDTLPVAAPKPHIALVAPLTAARHDTVMPGVVAAAERPEDIELLSAIAEGRALPDGKRHDSLRRVTWLLAKHCPTVTDETLLNALKPTLDALGDDEDWYGDAERLLDGARARVDEIQAEDVAYEALENERRGDGKGYAARFVRLYGDRVRFTDATGFLVWSGKHWQPDPNGSRVLTLGAQMSDTYEEDLASLRAALSALTSQFTSLAPSDGRTKLAARIEVLTKRIEKFRSTVITPCRQTHSIRAFLDLAKSALTIPAEDFDADPWTLNCENGTLDLRTGALWPHDSAALCSKLAPVEYDAAAAAPLFDRTLEQAMPDAEVRAFFQRAVGYALTGDMSEDLLFILLGSGGNGKSTLLNAIANVLGDYAGPAPKSLLMTSKHGAQSYELADLRGRRLVSVMELSQREYMDSSRLKSVVGGDRIIAARKYENQTAFTTQAKIFMPCNSKPRLNDDDEGAWRRIALIEFPTAFLGDERDRGMREALMREAPGILAWAVRGCLDWQRSGLQIPDACRQAAASYRHEENYVAQFVDDRVERGDGSILSSRLYDAYREWAQGEGVQPMSQKSFGIKLKRLGFEPHRTAQARMWNGVKALIS